MTIDETLLQYELPQVRTYSVAFGTVEDTKAKNHTVTITATYQDGKTRERTYKGRNFNDVKAKVHDMLSKATQRVRSYHITFSLFKNPKEENHQALIFLIEHNGNVVQKSIDGNSFEQIMQGAAEWWKELHTKQVKNEELEIDERADSFRL